jgi:Asp-tRNA(Asn)/Glu-tRNA(Gln) amidotransferase A subunit family amidase
MHDNSAVVFRPFTLSALPGASQQGKFTMAQAPNQLDAVEGLAAMAAGRLTAEELTRACLDRIAERDGEVHAFAHIEPDAALASASMRQVSNPH